jgi:hypothetical protein
MPFFLERESTANPVSCQACESSTQNRRLSGHSSTRTRPKNPLVARLMDRGNVFEGVVLEHRPAAGVTLLQWSGAKCVPRNFCNHRSNGD